MSYATLDTLKSRAGVLARRWDAGSQPGDGDLELYLEDTSAEIDAMVGGMGFSVPVTDPVAAAALSGWNADKALILALAATWPGGSGPQEVKDAIAAVQGRVTAYQTALDKGGLAAIAYLRAQEADAASGTDNFWNSEPGYSPWLDDIQSGAYLDYGGGVGVGNIVRGPIGPEYHKGWTRF